MNGEQQTGVAPGAEEDQARLELAMAAATAERGNQPRGLVILGVVLLLGAMVYTGSGWMARTATLRKVEDARREARQVMAVAAKVEALREVQASRGLAADPRVGKAIEDLATAAGVKADASGKALVIPETEVTGLAVPGVAQKKYTAKVTGQDPKALMQWLVGVQSSSETRGVEISQITLRPDASPAAGAGGGWSMDIEFVRWESRK